MQTPSWWVSKALNYVLITLWYKATIGISSTVILYYILKIRNNFKSYLHNYQEFLQFGS